MFYPRVAGRSNLHSICCGNQSHTILLRSDDQVVASGCNASGQCMIPGGCDYMPSGLKTIVFNTDIDWQGNDIVIRLLHLSGREHCTLVVPSTDQLVVVKKQFMAAIGQGCQPGKVVCTSQAPAPRPGGAASALNKNR